MAFSLIDDGAGAIPIAAVGKSGLAAWRDRAAESERRWLAAIGFTAEAGKSALIPGGDGRLARVLVGLGDNERDPWGLAHLPDTLPEGTYRIEALPESADPTRLALGWALATYTFTRYG